MGKLLITGAIVMAAAFVAPTLVQAGDRAADDKKKANDKAKDAAKGIVYELTVEGMS